jgi:hypothetical protein
MNTCGQCSTVNSERRKFCSDCGSLIVSFCNKCGFNNLAADKYCGGCGVSLAAGADATGEITREAPAAAGRYSAEDIRELTDFRSEGKGGKTKKKSKADEEQVSQDAVSDIFNAKE